MMHRRPAFRVLALAVVVAVLAAACGVDANDSVAADDSRNIASHSPTEQPASAPVQALSIQGGLPGFDITAVSWEGYWYSRYGLGALVMMSGLGVGFMPPMDAVMSMVQAVDQGPVDGEHVKMPSNPALLAAVFAGGTARLESAFNGDPSDLSNFRWEKDNVDDRLLPAAQAQTILKEVEWAKLFNSGNWAGQVDAPFGAMDRFKGMMMFAGAKAQSRFAVTQLQDEDGLFVGEARMVDGEVSFAGTQATAGDQYQMLQALTDLALVLGHPEDYNGVYADGAYLDWLGPEVDKLFSRTAELTPESAHDLNHAAQAVAWFAAMTNEPPLRDRAKAELERHGEALLKLSPQGVAERAQTIRGLLEVARVLGTSEPVEAALAHFDAMSEAYDPLTGTFDGVSSLSTSEVGDILGALNSLRLNSAGALSPSQPEAMLVGFFESVVNMAPMMRAVMPVEFEASPFELARLDTPVYFAYPGIPTPGDAAGTFGSAPVDVAEVAVDARTQRWVVSDDRFVTSSAMHASNEMFWIWGVQNGFPTVP